MLKDCDTNLFDKVRENMKLPDYYNSDNVTKDKLDEIYVYNLICNYKLLCSLLNFL
jgi:hypothetical protein